MQADAFAGELLAPERLFRPDALRLTFDRLTQLKAYWGLSMKGVIVRAEAVGANDRQAAVRLHKQFSARGYNSAEPFPLVEEQPALISQSIEVHLQEHDYKVEELARSIHLTPAEFRTEFLREAAI